MSRDESRTPAWILCALALATFIAYLPLWKNGFVEYDDPDYLLQNPMVSGGLSWAGVKWAFTHVHAANWHPLTWIVHMLECSAFGLEPRAHHAIALALHIANALLVCVVLMRMTAQLWPSACVAAIFALHPTHVESVAWASELKDVLSTFFGLLTVLAWVAWTREKRARRYLAALALYVAALLAKPTLITLPCALLLLDFCPICRTSEGWKKLVLEKLPFFAAAIGVGLATVFAQHEGGAVATLEDFTLGARIANAIHAYALYVAQFLAPHDLAVFYPHPLDSLGAGTVIASAALLAAISGLSIALRRSRPHLLAGWLWFLGTLVPMIGLVQVGGQSHADRYGYLSQLGLATMLVWSLAEIARRVSPKLVAASAVLAFGALGALTFAQVRVWKDTESLFTRALSVTENNYVVQNGLGDHYLRAGEPKRALPLLEAAASKFPEFRKAQLNYARALTGVGRFEDAERAATAWLARHANDAPFVNELVEARGAAGDVEGAKRAADAALALEPTNADVHRSLGKTLLAAGRGEDGLQHLQFAATLRPGDETLARDAEAAREIVRRPDERTELSRALRTELFERLRSIGERCASRRDTEHAIAAWENALHFLPEREDLRAKLELLRKQS